MCRSMPDLCLRASHQATQQNRFRSDVDVDERYITVVFY